MFCSKCGEMIADNIKFCPACGAPQQKTEKSGNGVVVNPQHAHYNDCTVGSHPHNSSSVSFGQAVALFFRNYVNFYGRSRRSEYWWVCLFSIIVSTLLGLIFPALTGIWNLVVFIPSLSLVVRRLHDIGKSGFWYFIILVPLVGAIMLLIWLCTDSKPQPNLWGPSPKY